MSVKKKITFSAEAAAQVAAVAKYQHRTFSNYVMHCTMAETNKRKKLLQAADLWPGDTLPESDD